MLIETHIPTQPLNELIEVFIYFKGYTPEHSLEKVVPDGSIYLIFELDDMPRFVADNVTQKSKFEFSKAWISGMHTEYITINTQPNSEMFVIKFKPYGAFPFFKQSLSEIKNSVVGAEHAFGHQIFEFREKLMGAPTHTKKFELIEKWLLAQYEKDKTPNDHVISICSEIQNDPALEFNTITELIKDTGLSKKHFLSLFKKNVGLTPKQLQRVFRFNEILFHIQKEDNIQWTQIALKCGYYDQSHFIKEFKEFCGLNPSKFISDNHDTERLNFFPLD